MENVSPGWLARLCARGPRPVFAIAAVLATCTLLMGFFVDDYVHILSIEGRIPITTPADLFCFASGDADELRSVIGIVPFPWFTTPDLKLHFFRPLSSATMNLDHALFGRAPWAYHAHSVLWYLLMIHAVWLLYRRYLPALFACLALLLFAVDDGHWMTAGWWSNRNALVAAVPALYGFYAHLRWREDAWRWGLPLSLLGYALGLLGGETALAVFAYLGAYELFGARGPLAQRIRALVPGALLGVVYLIFYKLGNYGVHGSGIYVDPVSQFGEFLWQAPARFTLMLAQHFWTLPVEATVLNPATVWPLLAASLVLLVATIALARRAWAAAAPALRAPLGWLFIGALLSLAPVLATFPSGRLTLVPSIGGAAAIALLLVHGLRAGTPRFTRAVATALLVLHLVLAPLTWPFASLAIGFFDRRAAEVIAATDLDPVEVANQIVIIPSAPDPLLAFYPLVYREFNEELRPLGWWALSLAPHAHRLHRTGPNTLELEVVDGALITTGVEWLMRDPNIPFNIGEPIAWPGLTATVLTANGNSPTRIAFAFDGNLDNPPYQFLEWKEGRLAATTPPGIGEIHDLPRGKGLADLDFLLGRQP